MHASNYRCLYPFESLSSWRNYATWSAQNLALQPCSNTWLHLSSTAEPRGQTKRLVIWVPWYHKETVVLRTCVSWATYQINCVYQFNTQWHLGHEIRFIHFASWWWYTQRETRNGHWVDSMRTTEGVANYQVNSYRTALIAINAACF